MKMRRWIVGILCLIMVIAQLSAPAEAEAGYDESVVLDQMAASWIETCTSNLKYCQQGLAIYALGQPLEESKEAISKQIFDDILNGYQETTSLRWEIDVKTLSSELNSDSLETDIKTYMSTSADAEDLDERLLHTQAENSIHDTVKNGEIAENVDLMDVFKENYAFFIGMICCETAMDQFNEALAASDLTTKREKMLTGAFVATIGCGMSIEDADALLKKEGDPVEEIMTTLLEVGVDLVSEIVPEIGIASDVLTITADVGMKVLSMSNKLDALKGYMESPASIEADMSAYFDALSNQYGLYTFEISELEVIMDEYNGYLVKGDAYEKVVVPETIYGFPVTGFSGCFAEKLSITEITIPSGVTSRALTHVINNCDKLETVYYNAVACEGSYLGSFFYDCDSDFEVVFGLDVTMIPERFILDCGITSIIFPERITTMHAAAVMDCAQLKTVAIPSTVTLFDLSFDDPGVIHNCENLQFAYYNAVDAQGSYYNAVFSHCGNNVEEMSLFMGRLVEATPATFLLDCGVKTVTFPEGMTLIRDYAISQCSRLETITIPPTVTQFSDNSVCDSVFSKCDNLKTVNYNAQNASCYLVNVFDNIQSDFTVNFGEGIAQIPERFISNCALTSIAFPDGVVAIRNNCLVNCDFLAYVTVPSTVTTIEYDFVSDCDNIDTIWFNANCARSPSTAMIENCGNTDEPHMKVLLGDNVTTVPEHFIENCGITEFTYPEGVTTINAYSLTECAVLKTVSIPSSVTSVGGYAVSDCAALTDLYYYAKDAQRIAGSTAYLFSNCGNTSGLELHFAADLKTLPSKFMYKCGVQSVTFPDSLTAIPEQAFYTCTGLTDISIGTGVTGIGEEAFYKCSALTHITIPDCVTEIGASAFANCTGLTEIIIPDSVSRIGGYAFYQCTGLTSVTYCGTPVQWCAITIIDGNSQLKNVPRSYHLWGTDASGRTCTICGAAQPIIGS